MAQQQASEKPPEIAPAGSPPSGAEATPEGRSFTQDDLTKHVGAATSKLQTENSALTRQNEDLKRQVTTAKQDTTEAKRLHTSSSDELGRLKASGDYGEDDQARAAHWARQEIDFTERIRQHDTSVQEWTIQRLTSEFPHIQRADLERFDNANDMEIFALRAERPEAGSPEALAPIAGAGNETTLPPSEGMKPQPDRGGGGNARGSGPPPNLRGADKIQWALEHGYDAQQRESRGF